MLAFYVMAAAICVGYTHVAAAAEIKCPADYVGKYPACEPKGYLPIAPKPIDRCKDGTVGVPPYCYVPCPANQRRNATTDTCDWIPCPATAQGEFYPDCTYRRCDAPLVGSWPNCHKPVAHVFCPAGLVGTAPDNCFKPCPPHHYGRAPNCTRVPCPNGRGWEGEFQPDCHFTPYCPDGSEGVWPICKTAYNYEKPPPTPKPITPIVPTSRPTPTPPNNQYLPQ